MDSVDSLVIGGVYEHYKGKRYRVLAICRHSETLEKLVYYECLYPNELGQMWVRPVDLFMGEAEVNGVRVLRFKPLT